MYNLNINPRLICRNDKVAAGDNRGLVRSQVKGAIRGCPDRCWNSELSLALLPSSATLGVQIPKKEATP